MILGMGPIRYFLNPRADPGQPYGPELSAILNAKAHELAFQEISSLEGYGPTPLLELGGLARRLGVRSLWYKDESTRLGLGSFKALGGIYGVFRALRDAAGGDLALRDVPGGDPALREAVAGLTVTCASVGNHGRAVARGAALLGCRAVIFLPARTPPERMQAIRKLGAEIVTVDGTYDDAVRRAAREAWERGWTVVSDTAYPGYEEIPRHIMQGYTVMVREALAELPVGVLPTHVFVQAGVGGLAAAVTAHLWEILGPDRPRVVVVEPQEADCLLESALALESTPALESPPAMEPSASKGSLATSMECLACRNPSTVAWRILREGVHAFLTIPDRAAEETVVFLRRGLGGDPPVHTQPSGAAGLVGLLAALHEPGLARPLHLDATSRVLVFGSEGPLFRRNDHE